MKNNLFLSVALICAIAISCRHQEEPKSLIKVAGSSQEIINNGISFDADQHGASGVQTKTFEFTATGDWSASISETKSTTWITLDPASGGAGDVTMVITVQPNTSPEPRTVTVTIVCGDVTITFSVTQEGALPEDSHYLTFTSSGKSEIAFHQAGDYSPVFYYSYDAVNWESWDYSPLSFSVNAPLYLCGDNPDGMYGENSGETYPGLLGGYPLTDCNHFVTSGDKLKIGGNIMSLINRENKIDDVPNAGFAYLFSGCQELTEGPELPAMSLSQGCYYSLFRGCTSLAKAPDLPATIMAAVCYCRMFDGCSSLTNSPRLPAVDLSKTADGYKIITGDDEYDRLYSMSFSCYESMFRDCTNLKEAPQMPATALSLQCYAYMFLGCTSLTDAPELPATELEPRCYEYMFMGCTSLIDAPALPAIELKSRCYEYMFSGCSGLTTAPELPAKKLELGSYIHMFEGCKSLVNGPELPATSNLNYTGMFKDCTSLVSIPPQPSISDEGEYGVYTGMFEGCTSLTIVPDLLYNNGGSFRETFKNCTSLVEAMDHLYATSRYDYRSMFEGCTSLIEAPELPDTELTPYCYERMFAGCTSLIKAPDLPATVLAEGCYSGMFKGCTSLEYIKCLATGISERDCTSQWVEGVKSSGTFIKNPEMRTWGFSADGVPDGWMLINDGSGATISLDITSINCLVGDEIYLCPSGSFTTIEWSSSNMGVASVDYRGTVKAIKEGVTIISVQSGDLSATCTVNVIHPEEENGHQWIDLGLPSGIKWATSNIGASGPSDTGDFFAWGETAPKSYYDWDNYIWCEGTRNTITKYNDRESNGIIDNKYTLELSDDAANINWGGNWCTPTKESINELIENCTTQWTRQNDTCGVRLTSKTNGNSIFLPVTGSSFGDNSITVVLMSSSFKNSSSCWLLYADSADIRTSGQVYGRAWGHPVRPVTK